MTDKDELDRNLHNLDAEQVEDVWKFARVQIASRRFEIEPPTAAQWARLPGFVKWWIVARVAWVVTWGGVCESWLRWTVKKSRRGL